MKLSIVSRGRNDNYGGENYKDKISFVLNKHISNFVRAEKTPNDVEIVFVDWGSDIPLHEVLKINEKLGFIRFIIVPPEITKNYDPPETKFSFVHSINTGIRRCLGDYILHCDFDVFVSYDAFSKIWNFLSTGERMLQYYFSRFHVHELDFTERMKKNVYDCEMNDVRLFPNPRVLVESPYKFGGTSVALLCHRKLFYQVEGYDERMVYWGYQDIDLFLRLWTANYLAEDLYRTLDVKLLHLDHPRIYCGMTNNPHLSNRILTKGINPNGNSWGIGNIKFEEYII